MVQTFAHVYPHQMFIIHAVLLCFFFFCYYSKTRNKNNVLKGNQDRISINTGTWKKKLMQSLQKNNVYSLDFPGFLRYLFI